MTEMEMSKIKEQHEVAMLQLQERVDELQSENAALERRNSFWRSFLSNDAFAEAFLTDGGQDFADTAVIELRRENQKLRAQLRTQQQQYQDFLSKMEKRILDAHDHRALVNGEPSPVPEGLCSRSEIANIMAVETLNRELKAQLAQCHEEVLRQI